MRRATEIFVSYGTKFCSVLTELGIGCQKLGDGLDGVFEFSVCNSLFAMANESSPGKTRNPAGAANYGLNSDYNCEED